MKLTLQKQDKELIHNMFAIAKKILKLSAYLVKLENNKQKDSLEYKKYQEYLTICLEIEEEYYKKMILNIINKVSDNGIDRKILLDACYSLWKMSKEFNLENELEEKIKNLERIIFE